MMSRLARIAVVNVPHHVTQRGNARQFILANDDERAVYWSLLRKSVELYELSLLGYCLMSNHVHLLLQPRQADSLAHALGNPGTGNPGTDGVFLDNLPRCRD